MGAILFKKALGLGIEDNSVIVADTSTLPYAVRIIADGKIAVYNRLGGGCLLATLPSSKNDELYQILKPVHPCIEKGKNIFQTCLQNANPMLHPCITTLNAARIEGPNDFFFYEEGVTPGVGRLLKAIDQERIAIGDVGEVIEERNGGDAVPAVQIYVPDNGRSKDSDTFDDLEVE